MFTSHESDGGSLHSFLFPPYRNVNFRDTPAIILVSSQLRKAWPSLPPAPSSGDLEDVDMQSSLRTFIQVNYNRTDLPPQNPDLETLHTPWRDVIYLQWNHVFWDVAGFLSQVSPGIGHFHPPAAKVFALEYASKAEGERATEGETTPVKKMVWETNILLIQGYLADGTAVRVTMIPHASESDLEGKKREEEGIKAEETKLGTWDKENKTECWYIRKGVEVLFYLEGEEGTEVPDRQEAKGIAAVMVWTPLCVEHHEQENGQDEEEE